MDNSCENKTKVKSTCAKCGEVKEICCSVDGQPWCEDCFEKALSGKDGEKHDDQ